jgi:hypothetical protein
MFNTAKPVTPRLPSTEPKLQTRCGFSTVSYSVAQMSDSEIIGDKTSLDQLIHDITNISLAALRTCPLKGLYYIYKKGDRQKIAEQLKRKTLYTAC